MFIGYARVSTEVQKLDLQIKALEDLGCDKIFADHGQSGSAFDREGLAAALRALETDDTLVVWRLDRLGRSLAGLVDLMVRLGEQGAHFRSVTENIDTSSSGGKLMFHMMAALAEFERTLISERTRAGMTAARERGSQLGRPKALTRDQVESAWRAIEDGVESPRQIAGRFNVSIRTLQRHIRNFVRAEEPFMLAC